MEQINGEISKSIVGDAVHSHTRLIVLEGLASIRWRIKSGLKVRARLHRRPFRQLQQNDSECRSNNYQVI